MAAALALLGLAAVAAAPAPRPDDHGPVLRRSEVAAMTPETLTRKLLGDMAQILYLVPFRLPQPRDRLRLEWLGPLDFLTRPRRASRAGLCETDALRVTFEYAWPRIVAIPSDPVVSADRREALAPPGEGTTKPPLIVDDYPLQPRRITMSTRYFVHDRGMARRNEPPEEEARAELDAACAAIDPRDKPPIFAGFDHEAGQGVELLSALIDAARAGRLPPPAECSDRQGARLADEECLNQLRQLDVDALISVDTIAKCVPAMPERYCVRLGLRWDRVLNFEMAPGKQKPLRIHLAPEPSLEEVI